MNKIKLLNISLLAMLSLTAMHCKPEPETYLITQDTKDYFDFPEGSYWVYVNDSMGFVDTLSLFSRDQSQGAEEDGGDVFELISLKKSSSYFGNIETDEIWSTETYDYVKRTNLNWFLGVDFFYQTPSGNVVYPLQFLEEANSAIVRGETYINVRKFHRTDFSSNASDTLEYWIARNVGVIRIELLHTDSIYELDSYFIP